ncbi:MAG: hypothetical protein FJW39_25650 [Acidobacteria bacterium]|nr:hypothetical protein [Acidobacteriota bacterium]
MRTGDDSQARILARTQNWLRVLEHEEQHVKEVLHKLWESCRRRFAMPAREEAIEKLRWLVAGIEHRIEAARPPEVDPELRFCVRWVDGDAYGEWKTAGGQEAGGSPLRALIADVAESEGGFSPEDSDLVASTVIELLRSGGWSLPNLIAVCVLSGSGETVFRLRERGEISAALTQEVTVNDALVEAQIEKLSLGLARALDQAICEGVAIEHGQRPPSAGRVPPDSMRERVIRIAEARHVNPKTVASCISALTVNKLFNCQASGDVVGAIGYGRVLKDLAPMILESPTEL